jgi:4-carboxymuconolactone decarboxylase
MHSGFPLPVLSELSVEQQAVVDSILTRRPSIDGPFLPWLHRPGLASAAERLGAYLRFDTQLSPRESELAILCVGAMADCDGEKRIHGPIARRAGLPDAWVDELCRGVIPNLCEPRLNLIVRICRELLSTFRLSDVTQEDALALFGPATMVELVALVGYYSLVAMTLNVFDP